MSTDQKTAGTPKPQREILNRLHHQVGQAYDDLKAAPSRAVTVH